MCQQCGTPGDGEQVTACRPPSSAKNIHHQDIFLFLNSLRTLFFFHLLLLAMMQNNADKLVTGVELSARSLGRTFLSMLKDKKK